MTLRSDRQRPERTGLVVNLRVKVEIVLRPRTPSVVAVIRLRLGMPEPPVELDEVRGKAAGFGVKPAQVPHQPFDLRLRLIDPQILREPIKMIAVAARARGNRHECEDEGDAQLAETMFRASA